jgi:general secretion pathway protein D
MSGGGGRSATPTSAPAGGPGSLGGAAMADFDSLIDLITSTIQPTTWDEVGGPGSIAPFETNLSLVISQTQEVHEEIVDLMEQLRRLQDLQVTIEVRFITLNDNFFERIGVDFDFQINDKTDQPNMQFGRMVGVGDPPGGEPARDLRKNVFNEFGHEHSRTVGRNSPDTFSADLDIPFTQNSYSLAVPQFGGFAPDAGMQMGFAILSEIEAYFFINAAQGDRRSNVLQAPKVTLFNGQMAFVADTSQSPFVISVVPVVGDFAAAQQPVIVILSEGTFLTVQAVVSNDRRFVRLTVIPFFSTIGKVDTFTFTGSETTTATSSADGVQDTPNDNTKKAASGTTTKQGTTVQLPTFAFVTVTTTVSVPDGGTVLLGGIKRLSEGRNEFGTPILNKIPYLNRLFNNVGIGRETQSLMMMVTPRIIIQEEEEERLGIAQPSP